MQLLVYLLTLTTILMLMRLSSASRRHVPQA
jgi:hypothetical protein